MSCDPEEIKKAWIDLCKHGEVRVEGGAGGLVLRNRGIIVASLRKESIRYGSVSVCGYGQIDLTRAEYVDLSAIAKVKHDAQLEEAKALIACRVFQLIGKPEPK